MLITAIAKQSKITIKRHSTSIGAIGWCLFNNEYEYDVAW